MDLFCEYLECDVRNSSSSSDVRLVADFTEYNPLHNGHYHCMKVAKSQVKDALFVAVVPGLFERSGRGIPYILPRFSHFAGHILPFISPAVPYRPTPAIFFI